MSIKLLKEHYFGDMKAHYMIDEDTKNIELLLIPAESEPVAWEMKKQGIDSLVQLKITGDIYPGGYAGGNTLRQSIIYVGKEISIRFMEICRKRWK